MSTYIEFDILTKLTDNFLKNIKLIFIFGHGVTEVLVVTKNDNVFGFGQNECGVLGLGHNEQVIEPKIIKELCGKGVVRFFDGLNHVMALTSDGKIYSWGQNELGVFGNGYRNCLCNKPEINGYLMNETVTELSCGAFHSLVLTKSDQVFAFGYNNFGQIGNKSEELFQLTPVVLNEFNREKVIAISCGYNHSLALTERGRVFSWGYNNCGQLGVEENDGNYNMYKTRDLQRNIPTLVKVKNDNYAEVFIEKICCGPTHSMLLSKDGNIYLFGNNTSGQIGNNTFVNQMVPQRLNSPLKYKSIASHFRYHISTALSSTDLYFIWGKSGEEVIKTPNKTRFKTIQNIFLELYQITHETVEIGCDFETTIASNLDCEDKQNLILEATLVEVFGNSHVFNDFTLLLSPNVIAKYKEPIRVKLNLRENMKISYSFYDYHNEWPYEMIGRNILIVREDDMTYSFGTNNNGLIGFGHKNTINKPIVVKELCQKGIIDFANGAKHVIARTNNNQLYIWGYNRNGELGNNTNVDCFVPQLVEKLKNKSIIDVCCGYLHSLALTESGKVYAWGSNEFGQVGNECNDKSQTVPIRIEELEELEEQNVVAIACGTYHSLALTSKGRVYSWGRNNCGQLGFANIIGSNIPKLIKIKNKSQNVKKVIFEKISCGPDHSLLLTKDGHIFGFGSNDLGQLANECVKNYFTPKEIENQMEFTEIASVKDCFISAALSSDGIFHIWGHYEKEIIKKPKATQFDSFNNIFLNFFGITHKLIHRNINSEKDSKFEPKQNGERWKEFDEFEVIAFGGFGIVSKAKKKDENEVCAVKRIGIREKLNESSIRELEIMAKLKSDYVVELKSFWIEENYIIKRGIESYRKFGVESDHSLFNVKNRYLLHIQMELCYKTLRQIIQQLNDELKQNISEVMKPIGYYIASELLIEILESVDYLHKQNPPILHRDLKPSNILIAFNTEGRFIKLADFGLAKIQKSGSQLNTLGVGTFGYIAPEVLSTRKYGTKADVFSLGAIIPEIFNFDAYKHIDLQDEFPLRGKYENLLVLKNKMLDNQQDLRPDCRAILDKKALWSLNINDIKNNAEFDRICNQSFKVENFGENFHSVFIKRKFEISKQSKQSRD